MGQRTRTLLAVVLTAVVVGTGSSYLAWKGTTKAIANAMLEMDAMNSVGRVESWDRLGQLLIKGCNKEALEYVDIQGTLELADLNYTISSDPALTTKIRERNPDVASRVDAISIGGHYVEPTCK